MGWALSRRSGFVPPQQRLRVELAERDGQPASIFAAYGVGPLYASCCTNLSVEEATRLLNAEHPTGIFSPWKLLADPTFSGGEPNPSPCERYSGCKHYLFSC